MSTTDLYETDFVTWVDAQARNLRDLQTRRWNGPLDLEHLAEEIEDLGRSQRHADSSGRSMTCSRGINCWRQRRPAPATPPSPLETTERVA